MKKEQIGMDLSIIVPVYNVEKYIRACIESIYRQGLDENCYELIIVNDGTKDQSMNIISDIIEQHNNIIIINQTNQGLSVARNNGISVAKGEYILMPDSDDLLIENSLHPLLESAIKSQADLIVADFISMTDEEIENINASLIQKKVFNYIEKTGEELFLQDLNPYQCYVWRTLFRREFLINNNLTFEPDIYIQDMPFTHECYLKANKCIRTSWLLNIYRKGHESATYSFNKRKVKDFCTAIAKTWKLTQTEGLSATVQEKLREDVWISFSVMTWIIAYKIPNATDRKEIARWLLQQAPDLKFYHNITQRITTLLFKNMPLLFIQLRYFYDRVTKNISFLISQLFRRRIV